LNVLINDRTQSIVLNVPDPFVVRDLIPSKSKMLAHPKYNLAVQHTIESTKVLRNIGYDVPAPINSRYNWPGKYTPFAHQRVMAEFLTLNPRCFNLSEMGVGKSAAALWAADFMMREGYIRKALILSPLSTLERVWKQDIFDVLMHRKASVVHGTRDKRREALAVDADFYILNHDGVAINDIRDEIIKRKDINLIIVDEGSMFRNHDTKKYKSLIKMIRSDVRLWWLTGTPCPNAPTDAWAQARIINPKSVPQFYGSFKRQTMIQLSQFKWSPKPNSNELAFEAMQPAVRFRKADCLDLPPVVTVDHQAPLTREQRHAYEKMRNEMQAEAKDRQITAVNAADKINKLRQILCGSVKDPATDDYILLPHAPRVDVLLDAIEGASAKVIVIVPFKGIIQALKEEVGAHYSVGVLNGDVSAKMRNQTILDFKTTPSPHVLLCHPKVMAHGLNLTEADTLVFYAPIYSNDEFQQVTERFNRAGQTRKMTIIRIGAHQLEWDIYRMVDNKRLTQDNILRLYEAVTK
jgi:SNF2 family DNA or RNA helicase